MGRHRGNRKANRIEGEEDFLAHPEDDLLDVDQEDRHEQALKEGHNPSVLNDSELPCQGEGRQIGLLGLGSPEPSVLDAVMDAEEDLKSFGISF